MKHRYWLSAFVGCAVLVASSVSAQTGTAIVGRWEGIHKADEAPMSFRFTSDSKGVMVFPYNATILSGFAFVYSLDANPKPMHFNFQVPAIDQPVQTILEIVNAQTIRLQLQGTNPGAARPTAFKDELKLQKVSETAIADLSPKLAQAEQSKAGEGRFVMTALARSAMIYELETNQLPTTLEQLGLNNSETQNYRFELSSQYNQLTLIARPKKAGFKSYVGVVSVQTMEQQEGKKQDIAISIVCQSIRASQTVPAMPRVAPQVEFACNSDSEPVQF